MIIESGLSRVHRVVQVRVISQVRGDSRENLEVRWDSREDLEVRVVRVDRVAQQHSRQLKVRGLGVRRIGFTQT